MAEAAVEQVVAAVRDAWNARSTGSAVWLRRLTREIMRSEPSRGVNAAVSVLAQASRSSGAVLWEASGAAVDPVMPAIVGLWFADGVPVPDFGCPDPVTAEALRTRTLVMAAVVNGRRNGASAVVAALPVEYLDGWPGALTLFGEGELTGEAFDVTVDLLDVLPDMCEVLRERRCLALVRRCNEVLQEAEAECTRQPLDGCDLSHHLGRVCSVIADVLGCREVTVVLREAGSPKGVFPVVARTPGEGAAPVAVRSGIGLIGRAIGSGRPLVGADDPPAGGTGEVVSCGDAVMALPLVEADQVVGAIACRGLPGPPFHFTGSDLSALGLIAPHVTQYWRNWAHRRAISVENQSWLLLAAGITAFNRLASEQLARSQPDDQRIYRAAMQIVQDVVPDCLGSDVHRSRSDNATGTRLDLAGSSRAATSGGTGTSSPAPEPRPFALSVLRTGRWRMTTDAADIAGEGLDAGWLTGTPIQVSGQPYGVLEAFGRCPTVPANALQVCEIVGDQLGLYLHLRQALQRLQETRATLQVTSRSQAAALEDLEHQLGGPLLVATERVDLILHHGRVEGRTDAQLRAVRGLCRKAMRVAMSAGVFAALSKGTPPRPKLELLSVDDILRLLISGADDAQLLSNPRRRIRFEVERDGVRTLGRRLIQADRSFVEQCVGNLLDNAAKYGYEGTAVMLRGSADDDHFAISVVSTGLPMNPADTEHCLRRNWRGPAARVVTGEGSGLGLWIADHLMRSMKGTVRVQPVRDTTTVMLTFPLA
jgi:signal transduction histidine kinase